MREGELTYDDFLRRLNIQDVLIDAGYHLNRRDGLRYPSYVRLDSEGRRIRNDKFIVTQQGKCCFKPQQQKSYNIISFIKEHPHFFAEYRAGVSSDRLVNLVCNRLLNQPVADRDTRIIQPKREVKPFDMADYDIHQFNPQDCTAPQKLDTFGVFFMKYNYEIRLKAVKLVLEGGLSVREAGCHLGCGRSQVHLWVTLFERHGLTGLKLRHGSYSAEFKLSVLKHMHQNHLSLLETAVHFGIPGPFVIRQWERLYQNQGAEGLRRKPQRRRPAMSKSKTKKVKLKTTPHEELLKELEYLRAENAYLKKLQALVEERIVRESGKEPKPSKD